MDSTLFCTAFILQFVGHRIGDYLLQTNLQALNKANNIKYRFRHCLVYSISILVVVLFGFDWVTSLSIFGLTFLEHIWIDSRTPVVKWKLFIERIIAGNKDYKIEDLPFFVLIEVDQTIHILRIFVISLLIGYGVI